MAMKKLKLTALLSLGSSLEFYDFIIYGLFSSYMANSFFPKNVQNPYLGFMGILLVFGIGYLARPLGGFLFGNMGDKYGRKFSFNITLAMMAFATFLVGLIPTYATIGLMAPFLLLLLRVIQGISMGAELPISSVFVYEHLSLGKNAFYGATLFGLSNMGLLIGNALNVGLTHVLPIEAIDAWGWRIPFILGGFLGVVAMYLRKRLQETPIFKAMCVEHQPWKKVMMHHKTDFFASVVASLSYGLCVNFGFVLLFALLEQFYQVPPKTLALLTLISTFLFCITDSLIGFVIDHFNIKLQRVILIGALQFSLSFYAVLQGYAAHHYQWGLIAMVWLTLATSCFDSVIPNLLPRFFPAEVRATGVASSYSIGLALAGMLTAGTSILVTAHVLPIGALPLMILVIHGLSILYLYRVKFSNKAVAAFSVEKDPDFCE